MPHAEDSLRRENSAVLIEEGECHLPRQEIEMSQEEERDLFPCDAAADDGEDVVDDARELLVAKEELATPESPPPSLLFFQPGNAADVLKELQALARDAYGTASSAVVPERPRTVVAKTPIACAIEGQGSLVKKQEAFRSEQTDYFARYVQAARGVERAESNIFFSFAPRPSPLPEVPTQAEALQHYLLPEVYQAYTTSFFFRWNGKGVVVNPGKDFLKNFHDAGFSLLDLDHVVVTQEMNEGYGDVIAIHMLNYRLNTFSGNVHLIHYHLHPSAHRHLAGKLKPAFKQEKNTVLALELYEDSPDVETVYLARDIKLSYFIQVPDDGAVDSTTRASPPAFGVRCDLYPAHKEEEMTPPVAVSLGIVSGESEKTHTLAAYLHDCTVLAVDQGMHSSLGGESSLSLLIESLNAQVVLSGEPPRCFGDCRLEHLAALRAELRGEARTVILPISNGFSLDLDVLTVPCSLTLRPILASEVRVGRPSSPFGPLLYLGPMSLA